MENLASKTSGKAISGLISDEYKFSRLADVPAQYHFYKDGFKHEFLWWPNEKSNKLFVFFSGDALREKFDLPVYQRWSWASKFPGSCVFFSDPTLHLSKTLSLAWYAGTTDYDPLENISKVVENICDDKNILFKDVFFYGSSGGGHAALRMLNFIEDGNAITINPQINIKEYHSGKVTEFVKVCYEGYSVDEVFELFSNKLNLMSDFERYLGKKIFFLQNKKDKHHYEKHCKPFVKKIRLLEREIGFDDSQLTELYFNLEGGHGKGESIEVFEKLMDLIERD
ncbi:hypothetical protein [Vreelandella malpeensis]|uniref:Alpha/beta hydrolase n=1 Tax=Vreelandella malpeensis TaxID=1172368 RepID=A0ABS8DU10_9GAMM|nr:hypothetical protein [Halomonas malpeensis]MCB8889543.1 hypothetical protein [Halomonas malpeensis]